MFDTWNTETNLNHITPVPKYSITPTAPKASLQQEIDNMKQENSDLKNQLNQLALKFSKFETQQTQQVKQLKDTEEESTAQINTTLTDLQKQQETNSKSIDDIKTNEKVTQDSDNTISSSTPPPAVQTARSVNKHSLKQVKAPIRPSNKKAVQDGTYGNNVSNTQNF